MEIFLKNKNAGKIFDSFEQNISITETERRKLICLLHEYLNSKCKTIKEHHMIEASKSLLVLFPCLEEVGTESSKKSKNGIVR